MRYGTVRDLLIGLTVVLPAGTVAKSGGKVVKNVAGYDLGKLFTGSLGTLGLIVEAIFRLHALPAARRIVTVSLDGPEALRRVLKLFLHSPLVFAALEVEWENGEGRLIAVFEGVEPGVVAQAGSAVGMAAPADAAVLGPDTANHLWQEVSALPWRYPHEVGLKISTLPAQLPTVLEQIEAHAARLRVHVRIRGQAAASVLWVWLGGSRESIAALVAELRERLHTRGTVVLAQAPPDMKKGDVWGEVGDAMPVMRRIKEQFDPTGIMNPGRFVRGI
jgi:glycolate oxidase FAD binding subunit